MASIKHIQDMNLFNKLVEHLCTPEGKKAYKKYYEEELSYGIDLASDDWGDDTDMSGLRSDARGSAISYVCSDMGIEVSDIDVDCFINTSSRLNSVIARSKKPEVIKPHLAS